MQGKLAWKKIGVTLRVTLLYFSIASGLLGSLPTIWKKRRD